MSFEDGFDGYEPYEDDLEALSEREAWEDSRADMAADDEDAAEDEDTFDQLAESVLFPWLDSDCLADVG